MSTAITPMVLTVMSAGPSSTIQDLGRPGWFSAGVGVSGAADRRSLTLANRLVGNPEDAACVETVIGGLDVQASGVVMVAVTGAPAPATVNGIPVAHNSSVVLRPGQRLTLGMAARGLRCYLAVRGGIAVDPVLGSRSTDTLSGIGPPPLRPGEQLPIGPPPTAWPLIDVAPVPSLTADTVVARVQLGPREDWFVRPGDLFVGSWAISDDVDRVGVRLDRTEGGPALTRRIDRELPTEGMPLGAIQVPPGGRPVVFLADHPITGGYPVIGTVVDADVGIIAQARPGQHIRFTVVRP